MLDSSIGEQRHDDAELDHRRHRRDRESRKPARRRHEAGRHEHVREQQGERASLIMLASSISARYGPEYSSTIASCTIVSSRCVAGLSTG